MWMYVINLPYIQRTNTVILIGIMAELSTGQALFGTLQNSFFQYFYIFYSAGESDIDQLYRIQKCLGPLPPKYMEAMKTNPKFEGLKVLKKPICFKFN